MEIEVYNMPEDESHPYALHIHEGNICKKNEFKETGNHYDKYGEKHPMHQGDLPPLFSNNGYSYMKVYTNRFTPEEIKGKTLIIHSSFDDFVTQPSGNSGQKIACGTIN